MNRSLLVGMLAGVALAAPQAASADVVTDWASYADRLDTAATRSELNFPGQAQVAAAMFEAADAIDRRYEPLLGMKPAPRGASMDAAIITAAHDVLAACYPDDKKRIDENARFALDALPDSAAAKAAGAAVGAEAARLAMRHGTRDPSVALHPYAPFTQAGKWVPTRLPVFGTFTQAMRPWAIGRIDAVRPAPPPTLDSDRYARDYDEVRRLGGKESTERTAHQSLMARYRITPNILPTVIEIADMRGRRTVQNARLLALLWIASNDYSLAMIDAKMHYGFWRPITAIRDAEMDGNSATKPDAGWEPLIETPNHPEYPCGHCGYAAAMATVFKAEVGNHPPGGVAIASDSIPDAVMMRLPTFDEWVREVSFSRTLGGVHYRFSNEAGEELGRKVGEAALRLMRPLKGSGKGLTGR